MEGIVGDRILRCSDGHLFTSSESGRLFGSVHFGPKRLIRCPVDGKYRMAGNVNSADLTPVELEQAQSYRT
ncbi:MAG TPA: hypothetical protein VGJ28_23875 [Micromonosporaceae bacterium]|jgi:hypothetical protein